MVKTDKNFYDRKIVYLDYLERGAKVKNGGFVKWEARGETSRIQIHIRGLYPTDTLRGEIQLISRQDVHTADNVKIDFGSGEYVGVWKNEDLAGTTVSFEECDGVQVKLSENRLLIGQWRKREALQEKQPEDTRTVPNAVQEKQPEDISEVSKTDGEIEEVRDEKEENAIADAGEPPIETAEVEAESAAGAEEEAMWAEEASVAIKEEEDKRGNEPEVSAEEERREPEQESASVSSVRMKEAEKAFDERKERVPKQESVERTTGGMGKPERKKETENKSMGRNSQCRDLLSGDKWEQLNKQYPHIHPFGDAREYLSITPRDFVILSRKYQELVQNSFLLHGYYNYGHVILTRIKEKNGERFYLGVPGVYYTREKQAALMFGFEGFEAGTEQAVDGGFGYYMKQVDI